MSPECLLVGGNFRILADGEVGVGLKLHAAPRGSDRQGEGKWVPKLLLTILVSIILKRGVR